MRKWLAGLLAVVMVASMVAVAGAVETDRPGQPGQRWRVDGSGKVAAVGGAPHFGDTHTLRLADGRLLRDALWAPIVGIESTNAGDGYWLVAQDSGVFAFGGAPFLGNLYQALVALGFPATEENVGQIIHGPVRGISRNPASAGYWLWAADGGVFAFGAPFHGSPYADIHLQGRTAVDFRVISGGDGYEVEDSDGRVHRCQGGTCAVTTRPPHQPTNPGNPGTPTPGNQAPGIRVWYGDTQTFGTGGVPQPWVNILGKVSDPDGINRVRYRLNGGPFQVVRIGPDKRRLDEPGDFNIDLCTNRPPCTGANPPRPRLVNGDNTLEIRLTDNKGNVQVKHVRVKWQPPATPPATTDAAQIVDGLWAVSNGQYDTVRVGYDRTLAIGDLSWRNYEVRVPIRIGWRENANTPQSGTALVGLGLRWNGHTIEKAADQPHWGFENVGAYAYYRWHTAAAGGPRITLQGHDSNGDDVREPIVQKTKTLIQGATYILKARVSGNNYWFKVWRSGTPEPAAWDLNITEPAGPGTGSVILLAHHFDILFGNVSITKLPG